MLLSIFVQVSSFWNNVSHVFIIFILLSVGILATLFVSGYEKRKKEALSLQNEN